MKANASTKGTPEAVKANDQGRGFSAVAQEINTLAKQSKQATTQVRGTISDIQKPTGSATAARPRTPVELRVGSAAAERDEPSAATTHERETLWKIRTRIFSTSFS